MPVRRLGATQGQVRRRTRRRLQARGLDKAAIRQKLGNRGLLRGQPNLFGDARGGPVPGGAVAPRSPVETSPVAPQAPPGPATPQTPTTPTNTLPPAPGLPEPTQPPGIPSILPKPPTTGPPNQPEVPPQNVGPVQQLGQDPFSQQITGGLSAGIASGGGPTTQFGANVQQSLTNLLQSGGQLDQSVLNQRAESLREIADRQRRAQISQLRDTLAARGLAGQGPEARGLQGIERDIGGQFATALRDLGTNEQEAANRRFQTGAQLGTGLAAQQPQNFLNFLNAGTGRQNVLSQIALDSLRNQQDFAQNVAQFGLQRDAQLFGQQQQGLQQLLSLLGLLNQNLSQARGGFI